MRLGSTKRNGLCGGGSGHGPCSSSTNTWPPVEHMSALVTFRCVSARIGQKEILHDLSFDVDPGETLVLLGRSGSGKTTALKMVNGLLLPSAGEVLVEETPTTAWDLVRLRRRIGYVIQDAGLFPHFTVAANVGLVPRLDGWPLHDIDARVEYLLTQIGLPPAQFTMRYPRELSGGQRQRVGVARALAADPPLLLLDEPFGALDPVTRVELQQQFLDLRDKFGKTALLVTHDVREALLLGTRIGVLHHGRLVFLGGRSEFLKAHDQEVRAFQTCLEEKWKDTN
jgi:osmoprotectant transport system ATP-binding protein